MASKFLTGLVASAMLVAPTTGVLAQSAPAPAAETVSSDSELRSGNGLVFGAVFFTVLGLLIIFQDDIFGDDDVEPVTP
ncbi:hypothetical protein E2493_08570 [Sphingomonas parva]|uniref:Uncharacterized protein n=1 Tax=Sphingomonas parva TaxID=2555898 RepID=A0A4Y8ZRM4_9SPHN|nr:hypothetical protein [Sphingomonas parva]TFI58680.1 hypothetical protein E2493_08570 [Sphingomonas parva]